MAEERSQTLSAERSAQTTTAELGIAYAKERQYDEALRYFQKADLLLPEARSYYGLALAMRRQRLHDAVNYCREAVDQEPLRGDFYHNLGQVHLARGERRQAIRTFTSGLQAEPRHAQLIEVLKRLGARRRPLIPFLSRSNPINKYLGLILYRIKKAV
jgi:tetratricopeptide (TPR) repeat protein